MNITDPSLLSNITGLCFIMTYKCNANCRFCGYSCSPKETKKLDLREIKGLLNYFSKHNLGLHYVVFSGGEPTLCWDVLLNAIRCSKNLGFGTRIVTNGHWAVTEELSRYRIQLLADAGLSEINFSTGTHHAEFIPIDNVIKGVNAAINSHLHTVVVVEKDEESSHIIGRIKENLINSSTEKILIMEAERAGFDLSMNSGNERPVSSQKHLINCNHICRVLTATPDDLIFPCCGLHIRQMPRLAISKISDLIKYDTTQFLEDRLFNYSNTHLSSRGPLHVIKELKLSLPDRYSQLCELCYFLYEFSDYFKESYQPNSEQWFENISEFSISNMINNILQKGTN